MTVPRATAGGGSGLRGTAEPPSRSYDVALLDLDGVVYIGPDAVPGVPAALGRAREAGMRLAFVTNNAARTPQVVAEHLSRLRVAATADEVITSAQAAAHYLAERLPASSAVLVLGTTGLVEALRERGLRPVHTADDQPAAVVQGYSPELDWRLLAEGCIAIRRGLPWVATNLDPTVPSPRGPLPGNGSLVAALQHATGITPVATGKPDPTMHRETVERSAARRPLVVGDRLDTDIAGARAVGCDSMLVCSGVTTARDLLAAHTGQRPDYIGDNAAALLEPQPQVETQDGVAVCRSWAARIDTSGIILTVQPAAIGGAAAGSGAPSDLDALRACAVAAWSMTEDSGSRPPRVSAGDDQARGVLQRLQLA